MILTGIAAGLVWSSGPLLTQDGPSHSYNAWILLHFGAESAYPQFYDVALYPTTNWLGGMLLTALGQLLPSVAAECLFVTLVLVLFVGGGARLLAREQGDLPAVALILPAIAFNYPLHMGFYSFCLGFALVPWVWVLSIQTTQNPRWRKVLGLGLLLVVTYLAHLVAALMAVVGLACIAVFASRERAGRRAIVRPLIAALPTIALAISYWSRMPGGEAVHWGWDELLETLLTFRVVAAYIGPQEWLATAMGLSILALAVAGVWRSGVAARRWWVIASIGVVLYALLPNGAKGHWFLSERLSLLPWLALLPLCTVQRFRWVQIGWFTTLAGTFLFLAAMHHAPLKAEMDALNVLADRIEPESQIISLSFNSRPPEPARAQVFLHAVDRLAVQRNAIDIGNYEGQTNHFQTRVKPELHWPHYNQVEGMPTSINPLQLSLIAQYVLTVDLDTHAPDYRQQLEDAYEPMAKTGRFQLFRRRIQRGSLVPRSDGTAPPVTSP